MSDIFDLYILRNSIIQMIRYFCSCFVEQFCRKSASRNQEQWSVTFPIFPTLMKICVSGTLICVICLKILNMGSISSTTNEMEIWYWIWDQYLPKNMNGNLVLSMGKYISANMKWKVGNMGSISSKTWNGSFVFSIQGT